MKIVDVNEFYAEQGGGVRTYVHAKFAAAAALGHDMVVVAPGDADREERRLGGRIIWLRSPVLPPDPRYRLLIRERALHEVLDREAPDVLESSSALAGGWFCGRWRGRALKSLVFHQDAAAVYAHTLLERHTSAATLDRVCAPYFGYLRAMSRRYHLSVTGSTWLAQRLRERGVHAPTPVPFGVDKRRFSPELRSEALRRHWLERAGLPGSGRLLVTVSRHHPEKRLTTLIGAVAHCAQSQPVGLVIFGDGPLRRWVEHRAARVPGVVVAGRVEDRDELARALASADALLHGSAAETFGMCVAEALCSGLPLIVPDRGGAAEFAAAGYAERYPAGDVPACAAAITRLLSRDADALRAAAAYAGREQVRSARQHFAELFGVYGERIGDGSNDHATATDFRSSYGS